jgi:uncharacterized protein YcbK (DUF882 family)
MTVKKPVSDKDSRIGRRHFLRVGAAAASGAALFDPISALASYRYGNLDPTAPVRSVSLFNLNTEERLQIDYWRQGLYVNDALMAINHFLRDHRDGSVHVIDPRLVDVLYALFRLTGGSAAIDVVCGYRSPRTNAWLHASRGGVASHSLHMQGKAVDIRVPGCGLSALHEAALVLRAGGVGYYPQSNFVHVDTGPVRTWGAHDGEEEVEEAPAWRDALLSDRPHGTTLASVQEPTVSLDAVTPRARRFDDAASRFQKMVPPPHKPMRLAARDQSPVLSEGFWVRRKPRLFGG